MSVAIMLDVVVAALLIATITYAVILNRKLGRMRLDRSGFEKMLKQFVAATERAESGVALLQRVADASASELDDKRGSTTALRDDLEFLVSRAEAQASKLETLIASGRSRELKRAETPTSNMNQPRDVPRKTRAPGDDPEARYLFEPSEEALAPAEHAFDESGDAEAVDKTPAWLASARKMAGVDEVLR
ncbi:MAG: DUF6468 domain-containing protein [Alphaproteobacteria bacterium]